MLVEVAEEAIASTTWLIIMGLKALKRRFLTYNRIKPQLPGLESYGKKIFMEGRSSKAKRGKKILVNMGEVKTFAIGGDYGILGTELATPMGGPC